MTQNKVDAEIDRIPCEFRSMRLKYGVERRNQKISQVPDHLFRVTLDMIEPWEGRLNTDVSADASAGLVKFQKGDVLVSKLRPYLAKAFVADQEGAASPELLALSPKKYNKKYLLYLLLSTEFIDRADASTTGASLPRASWRFIGNMTVPCPPEEVQQRIVRYLDEKTKRIDSAVSVCECLIEKIKLWEDATQIENLTRDGRVQLAGSDAFSQQIPENWSTTKIKWIGEVIDTKHRTAEYTDTGIPIISPSEVSADGLDIQNANRTTEEEYEDLIEDGRKPEPGDIIYSRNASVGDAALVSSDRKMCMGQDLCLIRSDIGEYLYHVINSTIVNAQVEALTVGATFDRINVSDIQNIAIPLPPDGRINDLTKKLTQSAELSQRLRKQLESLIEALRERRQVLISRAVTGKINLSNRNEATV